MTDAITLTIPRDRPFHTVAHLVLGGLAARLNLTIETLEDIQLALDSLLERHGTDEPVTLSLELRDDQIEIVVGPFHDIRHDFEQAGADDLGLRRVLDTVSDTVSLEKRDGASWVRLTKTLSAAGAV
jgi:hypothetical protein